MTSDNALLKAQNDYIYELQKENEELKREIISLKADIENLKGQLADAEEDDECPAANCEDCEHYGCECRICDEDDEDDEEDEIEVYEMTPEQAETFTETIQHLNDTIRSFADRIFPW